MLDKVARGRVCIGVAGTVGNARKQLWGKEKDKDACRRSLSLACNPPALRSMMIYLNTHRLGPVMRATISPLVAIKWGYRPSREAHVRFRTK